MAEVTLKTGSYLNFSRLLEFEGKIFWDETNLPDIQFSSDDEYFQINRVYANRVDLLAFDKYGDPDLFWVILQANDIDLPNQLYEGLTLRIPSRQTIEQLFQERAEIV